MLVEDTPELKSIIDRYNNVFVIYDDDSNKKDNYWTLIDRQKNFWNIKFIVKTSNYCIYFLKTTFSP